MPQQQTGDETASLPKHLSSVDLVRIPGGGFGLVGQDDWRLDAELTKEGWTLRAARAGADWKLRRAAGESGGFVLETESGERLLEMGRTSHYPGTEDVEGPASLLLADGRLFRILPRLGQEPRLEVAGWEVPGAYWIAKPRGDGWRLRPTPAGEILGDVLELLVLLAAEILHTE